MKQVSGTLTSEQKKYGDDHMCWKYLDWQMQRDRDIVDSLTKGDILALLRHYISPSRGSVPALRKY